MNNFDFPFVDAHYRNEAIPRLAGNPYVEALPALQEEGTLAARLTHLPDFDSAERNLPGPERIQRLDALQSVMLALPRVVRLAQSMLKMVRTGYSTRKPFSKEDNQRMRELYALQQTGSFQSLRQTALATQHSMSLIGASGSGKSFALRHIAGMLPPVIWHEQIGKWQLPMLFVEMSYDGESVHTLASGIFQELDRLLPDAGYSAMYMERRGMNAEQRLAKAFRVAHEHGVGMVVVDESQNQRSLGNEVISGHRKKVTTSAPKQETPLTKLLVTASNVSHIPLLLAGTLEMHDLASSRFTRARRHAGHGSAVWHPLERSGDIKKPGEFEMLLICLWRYQWVRNPVVLTDAWAGFFYHYTQGIPDMMVKLYESLQERAIATRQETLTPELLAEVFDSEFMTASFGITALRERDPTLLEAVTDLYQPSRRQKFKDAAAELPAPRQKRIVKRAPAQPYVLKPPPKPRPEPTQASLSPVQLDLPSNIDMRKLLQTGPSLTKSTEVDLNGPDFPA